MKAVVCGNIYSTMDYSEFKRLEGNRAVLNNRKSKVRSSIERNGYIQSPLGVNGPMEIIDGQARFEVLKEKDMPIEYYIVPGAGIAECVAMNIYGTKWGLTDYINSYAEQGNENYKRFKNLLTVYKGCSMSAVYFATKGTDKSNTAIMNGTFVVTEEEENRANELLPKYIKFLPAMKKIKGKKDNAEKALLFILGCDNVDTGKLLNRLNDSDIPSIGTTTEALRIFSEIYNYRSRSVLVAWDNDFENYMRKKFAWYEAKWGNRD